MTKYAVTISDGETPLIEQDFRTRKAAAEYVAGLIAGSRLKYLRIEIGVQR